MWRVWDIFIDKSGLSDNFWNSIFLTQIYLLLHLNPIISDFGAWQLQTHTTFRCVYIWRITRTFYFYVVIRLKIQNIIYARVRRIGKYYQKWLDWKYKKYYLFNLTSRLLPHWLSIWYCNGICIRKSLCEYSVLCVILFLINMKIL